MEAIWIETVVCCKVGSNRSKEMVRYEGPFNVVVIRDHNIVTIQSIRESTKRRMVHIQQLKFPIMNPDQTSYISLSFVNQKVLINVLILIWYKISELFFLDDRLLKKRQNPIHIQMETVVEAQVLLLPYEHREYLKSGKLYRIYKY